MNKDDIVFRFIGMRGPDRTKEYQKPIAFLENDNSFVEMIREWVDNERSFESARVEVATEFMNSERYVMHNADWRGLVRLERRIAALLREAHGTASAGGILGEMEEFVETLLGEARGFREELEKILKSVFGQEFDLKQFADGDTFRDMRQDLWHSYYSNAILHNRRPQDRSIMLFWVRLFELIPTLWDEERFTQVLNSLDTMRPAVPQELLRVEVAEQDEDTETDDDEADPLAEQRAEIEKLRNELEQLQAATANVRAVYREKRREANREQTLSQPIEPKRPGEYDDNPPPWRLKPEELNTSTLEILAANQLSLERATAPEIIHQLQNRTAETFSDLDSAQYVEEIVFRRGTFVRVRRRIT